MAINRCLFRKKLEVERMPDGTPLDMSQHGLVFGTTRLPLKGSDQMSFGCDRKEKSRHIIVMNNGHVSLWTHCVHEETGDCYEFLFSDFQIECL